jgi:hypothetical protein
MAHLHETSSPERDGQIEASLSEKIRDHRRLSKCGSLATFAAIRRASSSLSNLAADRQWL